MWYIAHGMKVTVRRFLWLLMAALVLFEGLTPSLATADVTMKCAGQSASTPSCAHATVSLSQGRPDAAMSMMPCCKAMTASPSWPTDRRSRAQFTTDRHCIVTIFWTTPNRQTPALSSVRRAPTLTPTFAPAALFLLRPEIYPPATCNCTDSGPPVESSNANFDVHGPRAPPAG
jgi:hypothetical protein